MVAIHTFSMRFILLLMIFCAPLAAKLEVLVSIPPLKYFVDEIGGDLVEVTSIVPAGAGPHTYQPTPRQVNQASSANIWIPIGEGFEQQIRQALRATNPHLTIVNIRKRVPLIYWGRTADPHIWLSPRRAKIFSNTIAQALINHLPEHKAEIRANLYRLESKLDTLDKELQTMLKPCRGETILVSHPAFGYFCADYGLHQLSIEFDGKDPSPRQLASTLSQARALEIKNVIIDKAFRAKGAKLVAENLDLPTCTINPLAEDYIENLLTLGRCICQ